MQKKMFAVLVRGSDKDGFIKNSEMVGSIVTVVDNIVYFLSSMVKYNEAVYASHEEAIRGLPDLVASNYQRDSVKVVQITSNNVLNIA